MAPLYSRAAAVGLTTDTLNGPLRAALVCLQHVLGELKPAIVPWPGAQQVTAVLYADAYFRIGDVTYRPYNAPDRLRGAANHTMENGWGFVLRVGTFVTYDFGMVPASVIRHFCSRRAYIFFLEILAQLIPLMTLAVRLPRFWIGFIDNSAGEGALRRGWGRDEPINNLIALYTSVSAHLGWHSHYERVSSADNISDKISRQDESMAVAMGWQRAHVPLTAFLEVILLASADVNTACTSATTEMLEVSRRFCAAWRR
jgi:hypothetical protein